MTLLVAGLLSLSALAAKPGPRGPADFQLAVYLPKLERGAELAAFARAGSTRTVLLRSESWRDELHPLLHLDVTRPEEGTAAGIDVAAPFTVVNRGGIRVSCAVLKDPKLYEQRCNEKLSVLGSPWNVTVAGARVVGSRDSLGRILSGYAIKGDESCAAVGDGLSVEAALKEAAGWLGKPAAGSVWAGVNQVPGIAYVIRKDGVVGLNPNGLTLVIEARSKTNANVTTSGPSPYAKVVPSGLATIRLRAAPGALTPSLEYLAQMLVELCPACDRSAFQAAADALAPTLSGNVILLIQKVKVQGSLRSQSGRFFAPKMAVMAEAVRPDDARAAIDTLAKQKGAKRLDSGEGLSLLVREGEVRLGVREGQVFFTNDAATLDILRGMTKDAAGTQAHGAELVIDPKLLANGLSQVPLLDAVSSQELAGVLAAGAELGPLLLSTDRLTAWADAIGNGNTRAQLTFKLKDSTGADAGTPVAVDAGP